MKQKFLKIYQIWNISRLSLIQILKSLRKLRVLSIRRGEFETLDLQKYPNIEKIYMEHYVKLQFLKLNHFINLQVLGVRCKVTNNQLTENIQNLEKLEFLPVMHQHFIKPIYKLAIFKSSRFA